MKTNFKLLFLFCLLCLGAILTPQMASSATVGELSEKAFSGDVNAQYQLGNHFFNKKDYKLALKFYRMALEQDHPDAIWMIGSMYKRGEGVPKDIAMANGLYQSAVKIFERRAEEGDIEAQYRLGQLYQDGRGVPKDLDKSCQYFKMTALSGYPKGQFEYGRCLEYGRGLQLEKNAEEAVAWYRKAADQGFGKAKWYLERLEGKVFFETQMSKYLKAAEQGDAAAQFEVGKAYQKRDKTQAYAWISVSAAQARTEDVFQERIQALDELERNMKDERVAKGQAMAAEIWARLNAGSAR